MNSNDKAEQQQRPVGFWRKLKSSKVLKATFWVIGALVKILAKVLFKEWLKQMLEDFDIFD